MARRLVAVGLIAAAFGAVALGFALESSARDAYEPIFESGFLVLAGLVVGGVLVVGAYVCWPKAR